MKRTSILVAIFMAWMSFAPAQAHRGADATAVSFAGAVPCALVCAYWVDMGFSACEKPFPPGSYVDHLTTAAPSRDPGKIVVLEATLDSEIDWDGFLCADEVGNRELAQLTSYFGPCESPLGPWAGCHEDGSTPVVPGQRVIFRAYNWSDAPPATGHFWFFQV